MTLADNRRLYEYLLTLASKLKSQGREDLGQIVVSASRQAAGLSTEFLGESRIALREVAREQAGALTEEEARELTEVLQQLDAALDRR